MNKILVVVDMQNDFITGPLGNEDCRNAVAGCVDLCKDKSFDEIIFTQDTHHQNYLETLEGKKLPVVHCIQGTEGWNIVPELQTFSKMVCSVNVIKKTFGSISNNGNNLTVADHIKAISEDGKDIEIHFCGVCTSICVLANMIICRAYFPNVRIVLHKNATGDVTPEMKQAAFICAKSQQCDVED